MQLARKLKFYSSNVSVVEKIEVIALLSEEVHFIRESEEDLYGSKHLEWAVVSVIQTFFDEIGERKF